MASSGLPTKTEFRSPEIWRIEELVRRVKDGDIKLPKFQRPFVWTRGDILTLWDSVYRGYPIGSLLLWLTKQRLASEREIGDLDVTPRAEEYPTNYLLDGQQRLSSLCGVLFWPGNKPKSPWDVAFDLREETFFHPDGPLQPSHFPLRRLLETEDFIGQCMLFQGEADRDLLSKRAQRLLSAVKDYKIAAVVLADMDLQKVGPVFERINSKGRRLTIVDLMRAATWRDSFDINDTFNAIRKGLEQAGYGNTDLKAILRNISAACGKGITVDGIEKLKDVDEAQLREASRQVEEAYRHAVDFLKRDVHVPSDYLLPYRMQLTLLAEFFRIRPSPLAEQRTELSRWFWRTSLTSFYKSQNTKEMKTFLERMVAFANDPTKSIADVVPFNLGPEHFLQTQFALKTAGGKAFALLLATRAPRGLLDGARIDLDVALAKANRVEFHHVFPRAYLERRGVDKRMQNQLANICMTNLVGNRKFTDSKPSAYLQAANQNWGTDAETICASNYIDDLAWLYAIEDGFEEFCHARAEVLIGDARVLCGVPSPRAGSS